MKSNGSKVKTTSVRLSRTTQSDELTLGYYISNQLDFAHIDFGVRYDRIDRETEDGHYMTTAY